MELECYVLKTKAAVNIYLKKESPCHFYSVYYEYEAMIQALSLLL